MRLIYLFTGILLVTLSACTRTKDRVTIPQHILEIAYVADSISSRADVIDLDSYGLSYLCPANNCVYAYNYKEHTIDVIDLNYNVMNNSIKLVMDGPNAVMHELYGLKVISPDTIAVYDLNNICIMDGRGIVFDRIELPHDLHVCIDCNARSNISDFKIDFATNKVTFPAANRDGMNKYSVVEYDYKNHDVTRYYDLEGPTSKGNYGFMRYPNVSYNQNLIIYNYPFESDVYVLDSMKGESRRISVQRSLCADKIEQYSGKSIEAIGWHGAENYFFSPLYYIPEREQYIQVVLGKTTLDHNSSLAKAYYDRPFYLTVFDNSFVRIGEIEINRHKYSPYAGWFHTLDGIAFYIDNVFYSKTPDYIYIDKYFVCDL